MNRLVLLLSCVLVGACSKAEPVADSGDLAPTTPTVTECAKEIPSPGTDPSPSDWISDNSNTTTRNAWPVGVVTDANGPLYVQTILPSDKKNAYFVFQAGADMELRLRVQNSQNPFELMHLHDGSDLCFGDQIPAVNEDVGANYIENRYDVEDGRIYAMEIRIPGGGFF